MKINAITICDWYASNERSRDDTNGPNMQPKGKTFETFLRSKFENVNDSIH